MVTQVVSTGTFFVAKWIVSPNQSDGTHTSIQTAINDASSGDTIFVRQGTYTENITISKNVNIYALGTVNLTTGTGGGGTGITPTIIGTITISASGINATINGILISPPSGSGVILSGTNSILTLNNCVSLIGIGLVGFNCSGNSSTRLNLYNTSLIAASNLGQHFTTSNAQIYFQDCSFSFSTDVNTISAGKVLMISCLCLALISTSSTGVFFARQTNFGNIGTTFGALTFLTTAGSGTNYLFDCDMYGGASAAISIGTGTTVQATNVQITSSATNVITGAGTLNYAFLSFPGASSGTNVTTQNAINTLI